MSLAQYLYEQGLITYMRTDSVNLAPLALNQAREYIEKNLGKSYLPKAPRVYKTKSRNAQEAHEAIRPTNVDIHGETLRNLKSGNELNKDHLRLYELIWKRFISSQIMEAIMDQTTIDVSASTSEVYLLRATGSVIRFEGWLKIYGKSVSEEEKLEGEKILPAVKESEKLKLLQILPGQHFTEPHPRYTEASLIKKLEELGIGRPSTYAPIISTIIDRYYVERVDRKLLPTSLGFAVIDFLMKYFSDIVDFAFTASMEAELDEITQGKKWQPIVKDFYIPFEKKLEDTTENAEKVQLEVETTDRTCSDCGKPLVVRFGKFGKFLACSGFPECKHTEGMEEPINLKCPDCGGDIVIRHTKRKKIFYGCKNWPTCKFASWTKPVDKK